MGFIMNVSVIQNGIILNTEQFALVLFNLLLEIITSGGFVAVVNNIANVGKGKGILYYRTEFYYEW